MERSTNRLPRRNALLVAGALLALAVDGKDCLDSPKPVCIVELPGHDSSMSQNSTPVPETICPPSPDDQL